MAVICGTYYLFCIQPWLNNIVCYKPLPSCKTFEVKFPPVCFRLCCKCFLIMQGKGNPAFRAANLSFIVPV